MSLRDMKVGDILIDEDENEAKVLAILGEVFLISYWNDFNTSCNWYTFSEAERRYWELKEMK